MIPLDQMHSAPKPSLMIHVSVIIAPSLSGLKELLLLLFLLMIWWVRNLCRLWHRNSHLGSLMQLQSDVGGGCSNLKTQLGWRSQMVCSHDCQLIWAFGWKLSQGCVNSTYMCSLQCGSLREVGTLTWFLASPRVDILGRSCMEPSLGSQITSLVTLVWLQLL